MALRLLSRSNIVKGLFWKLLEVIGKIPKYLRLNIYVNVKYLYNKVSENEGKYEIQFHLFQTTLNDSL